MEFTDPIATEVDSFGGRDLSRAAVWHRILVMVVLVAMVPWLYIHLTRPLWGDEMTTLWYVEGDWNQYWSRVSTFGSRLPLFATIMWLWTQVAGTAPWALRMPSVIGVVITGVVMFRVAEQIAGRTVGWISVTIFCTTSTVIATASNARSYGLLIMCIMLAHLYAIRWIRDGRNRHSVLAVFWCGVAVNLHVLAGFAVIAVGFAIVLRLRRGGSLKSEWVAPITMAVVVLAPLVRSLVFLVGDTSNFTPLSTPTFGSALERLVSIPVLLIVFLALAWTRFVAKPEPGSSAKSLGAFGDEAVYIVIAAVLPVLLSFSVARSTGLGVFTPRYVSTALAPASIVLALVLGSISVARIRLAATAGAAAFGLLVFAVSAGSTDNWQSATAWVNEQATDSDIVVLVEPYHMMGRNRDFFSDIDGEWIFEDAESLTWVNPIESAHPINAAVYGLPWASDSWGVDYLESLVGARIVGYDKVILIAGDYFPGTDYRDAFRDRLEQAGYREEPRPELDRDVLVFVNDVD